MLALHLQRALHCGRGSPHRNVALVGLKESEDYYILHRATMSSGELFKKFLLKCSVIIYSGVKVLFYNY